MEKIKSVNFVREFIIPITIAFGILFYLALSAIHHPVLADAIVLVSIGLGSYGMVLKTLRKLFRKQFALDYIAILAILVAIITGEYLVGAILALMIASGETLEDYGSKQAKRSLAQLVDRIPTDVVLWEKGKQGKKEKLGNIKPGDEVFIRKGEVIGLDGVLVSPTGETDESSLTGEPYFITKLTGDQIRSGTVNIGQAIVVKVTRASNESTYKKIVDMVKSAQEEKSPMVRLADKYSTVFTIVTFVIAVFAYVNSNFDLSRVLAVLAVATPCPLIIATPIALLGGVNASAKRKIIVKKLASLEILSRVNAIAFDKTGTITLGKPLVSGIKMIDEKLSEKEALAIAEAIERNSLHPLAKALVIHAAREKAQSYRAENVHEIIGNGIAGKVNNREYTLAKINEEEGMAIGLLEKDKLICKFYFEDKIKEESKQTVAHLNDIGLQLYIYTGDKKEAAQKIVKELGENIIVNAECTPEDKQRGIQELKREGKVTAMVGDGINDAPALALADVGMAFSDSEQTAASEAASIVFLGGDFSMVLESWKIAKRTIVIAKQSIMWGIGLSVVAMLAASVGIISPLYGAGLQEAIDVGVILNALRASK